MGVVYNPNTLDSFHLQYEDIPILKYGHKKSKPIAKLTTIKQSNRGITIKYLTNLKSKRTLNNVIKAKRKAIKMTQDKTKKSKGNIIKSIAWLVEATFRTFVGWVLLNNFDNMFTTAVACYALGTAGIIVVAHFVRANR